MLSAPHALAGTWFHVAFPTPDGILWRLMALVGRPLILSVAARPKQPHVIHAPCPFLRTHHEHRRFSSLLCAHALRNLSLSTTSRIRYSQHKTGRHGELWRWTHGRRRSSVRATPHLLSTSLHFSVPILATPHPPTHTHPPTCAAMCAMGLPYTSQSKGLPRLPKGKPELRWGSRSGVVEEESASQAQWVGRDLWAGLQG